MNAIMSFKVILYRFRYIIIGDMGVGKSCLLHQFTEKKFMASCPVCRKNISLDINVKASNLIKDLLIIAHNWRRVWNENN
jgi:GTPase SAR1 family protein